MLRGCGSLKIGLLSALFLALFSIGCAPGNIEPPEVACARPTTSYGLAAQRADAALTRLQPFYSGKVNVEIIRTPVLGAYSEPGGRLFLTTGLANLLDDNEITAALAHELGHLTQTEASPNGMRFSLAGPMRDIEQRADAEALVLLSRVGVPVTALAHTLEKVRNSRAISREARYALATRIALLPR